MDSPGWSLQESLDSPVFSLCETSDSLRESNWTLMDSFAGVFARVDSRTLAEILTLDNLLSDAYYFEIKQSNLYHVTN